MKLTAEATIFDDQKVSEDIVYLSDGIDETNVRVDATNTRVDAVNDDIYEINGNISQINDDIDTLEDDMAGIEDEIDDLGQAIGDVSSVAADALNSATKIFGTCATQAQVAAKEVTCSGFKLFTGATINVLFTNSNTSANATLNVNNTGAKPIKVFGASTSDSGYSAGMNWAAGELVTFTYDGTNSTWLMQSVGTNFSGVCDTAAGTAAKVVTCKGFVLHTGAMIAVRFSAANTVANPTLNVNGTGAKAINANGSNLSANSPYNWSAGDTVIFTYNGTQWVMDKSLVAAVNAQTSANSKNKVFYQETAPSTTGLQTGDTWFKLTSITDPGGQTSHDAVEAIYMWDATSQNPAWVEQPLSDDALDVFTVARAIIAYLDVYSLTADQITALFGTFKGIRSKAKISGTNDPVSSWDLDSGEFKTVNGKFTGTVESSEVKGSTITGSSLRTAPQAGKSVTFSSNGSSAAANSSDVSGDVTYNVLRPRGLQAIGIDDIGTAQEQEHYRAQIIPAINSAESSYDKYGWYLTHYGFSDRFYNKSGRVPSFREVQKFAKSYVQNYFWTKAPEFVSQKDQNITLWSKVEGSVTRKITGYWLKSLRLITITFDSFVIPAGTAVNTTSYRLSDEAYYPVIQLDLESTYKNPTALKSIATADLNSDAARKTNFGRFYITTDGYVRPVWVPLYDMPIRGTFTYITKAQSYDQVDNNLEYTRFSSYII